MDNLRNLFVPKHPFGAVPKEDTRNALYPIGETRKARSYTWSTYFNVNQDANSCVGCSITGERAARPVVVKNLVYQDALKLYKRALQIDEWAGEADNGTSLNAGMSAAVEIGAYSAYLWTRSVKEAASAVSWRGPVVATMPWYTGMFSPDSAGYIYPTGQIEGYHAILWRGHSEPKLVERLANSWSKRWGLNGDCLIHQSDLAGILSQTCLPITRTG